FSYLYIIIKFYVSIILHLSLSTWHFINHIPCDFVINGSIFLLMALHQQEMAKGLEEMLEGRNILREERLLGKGTENW
ncbi:hypothetical protein LINGRAHAP2_LOCUS23180, partial [Linum grandiflorum]